MACYVVDAASCLPDRVFMEENVAHVALAGRRRPAVLQAALRAQSGQQCAHGVTHGCVLALASPPPHTVHQSMP